MKSVSSQIDEPLNFTEIFGKVTNLERENVELNKKMIRLQQECIRLKRGVVVIGTQEFHEMEKALKKSREETKHWKSVALSIQSKLSEKT